MIILALIDSRLDCVLYNIKFTINLISDYYKLPTILAPFIDKNFKWLITIKLIIVLQTRYFMVILRVIELCRLYYIIFIYIYIYIYVCMRYHINV